VRGGFRDYNKNMLALETTSGGFRDYNKNTDFSDYNKHVVDLETKIRTWWL
jgi:hypothetical protein